MDEPTGSPPALGTVGSPNQGTSYTYNALDNLIRVTQGSQTRTFAYDSLSRLASAANPESGTINYTYDKNGNLTQKTDARGVQTTYAYDALDRLTRRSYSYTGTDSSVSLGTTQVDYDYDNCGGTPDYSEGRLCSVIAKKGTTVSSKTAYANYDALGRVGKSTQTTGGQAYTMAYAYDRAGNLISQTYPSGKVVETLYDGAGRVAGVRKKKADRTYDYYAGGVGVANAIGYAAHGGIERMRLGNALWEQRRYNRRLQPTQIGLGTARTTAATLDTATSPRLLLDYSYGTTTNNGNVASQQIRVGTLDLTQSYAYDKLNRLTGATERRSGTETWSQTYQYDVYGNRAVTAGRNHGSTPGPDAVGPDLVQCLDQPSAGRSGLRRSREPDPGLGRKAVQVRRGQPHGELRHHGSQYGRDLPLRRGRPAGQAGGGGCHHHLPLQRIGAAGGRVRH